MTWQRKQEGWSKGRETEKALGVRPGEERGWSVETGNRRAEDGKEDLRKMRQRALESLGE